MLRSRKHGMSGAASANLTTTHIDDHATISSDNKQQPLIRAPVLIGLVLLFIFLGIASEHYNRTREHFGDVEPRRIQNARAMSLSGKSLLTPREDASLEYDSENKRYHVIFSTDCSPYQHWQSYLVYYTAMKVKQPGHVIRIASGCETEEANSMQLWFDENVQYMSKRFHLMLTPHFSQVKNDKGEVVGDYKFFNKPFGLKYWLENFEQLQFTNGKFLHENDVVILIDPDMPLLRPITSDFTLERETLIAEKRKGEKQVGIRVERGKPFAQTYGLGTQWQKFDLDKIAGADSPAKEVSREDGALYYPVGPPYLATVGDMYQISVKWTEFVPRVHEQYPHLLAEMYAYCIAAAHLGLRHQIVDSLMISNTGTGGEGWPLIDKIPAEEMCEFAAHPDHDKYALPKVAHLCQRYCVGDLWFFGKRKIPHDIYDCETPLFIEPPKDLATLYTFKKPPNAKQKTDLTPRVINQEAFMVCYLTRLLNEASLFYKANACPNNSANLEKSRTVADLFKSGRK